MKELFDSNFPGRGGAAAVLTLGKPQLLGATQTRLVPCSTFKLVLALAGLQRGVISSAQAVWLWNGEKVGIAKGRKDMNLATALWESSEWYFREVARKLGAKTLREVVQELGYGSGWSGKLPEDAWHDGTLTISTQEQAVFASKLAAGTLPFSAAHQALVRESLRVKQTGARALWGKTGSSAKEKDGRSLGWYVGAYSEKGTMVAFAVVRHAPGAFGPDVREAFVQRLLAR